MNDNKQQDGSDGDVRNPMDDFMSGAALPSDPEPGTAVQGVVVQLSGDTVFLDIGAKSEAAMAREELCDESGELTVGLGDTVEATVLSVGETIRVGHKLSRADGHGLEALAEAQHMDLPVEGKVEAAKKGGFDISFPGKVRAFCPISQIDLQYTEQPEQWVGRTLEFMVVELKTSPRNVVVSRRKLLEREREKLAQEARALAVEGAVLEGRVSSLQSYGAFVDLGGIEGLLHVSQMAHRRIEHPSELLSVDDVIKVQVLKVDQESGKLSLGIKQLQKDPWDAVTETVRVGARFEGKIVRVLEFGAFVELIPGIDGLLHVSELEPGRRGADARKLASPGDMVPVKVLSVDVDRRRIALARVDPSDPAEDQPVTAGMLIQGKVERVESFGVFVRLGPGRTGLIHNKEMGTSPGTDHRKQFAPGTPVEAVVLSVEEDGKRISLSRAQAMGHKERQEFEKFQARDEGAGAAGFSTMADALRNALKPKPDKSS
jgi:small subunit ribosomal protein S1